MRLALSSCSANNLLTMPKIFLITKLKTTNVGNQALSEELIRLFTAHVGKDQLIIDGRPMGLDSYSEARIKSSTDPLKTFERWADAIVSKFASVPEIDFTPRTPSVTLLTGDHPQLRFEKIKARIRPLKRFLSRIKAYNAPYRNRLQRLQTCEWLVYSGAGEVGDNNVFLRQLIELRVAQKLGKKTAAVNQSVVIKTSVYQKLVAHVYGHMDKIVVRGDISRSNLISYGVTRDVFEIAPDTALNTTFHVKSAYLMREGFKKPVVGINFTPRVKLDFKKVEEIVKKIKESDRDIVFLTNEPFEDGPLGTELMRKFGVSLLRNPYDYVAYCSLLGELEFLISTRLHSNVLALVAGTPIIPIEGNVFKTTELLRQLQYPVPVVDPSSANWIDRVIQEMGNFNTNLYDWEKYFEETLPVHKKRIAKNASWLQSVHSR